MEVEGLFCSDFLVDGKLLASQKGTCRTISHPRPQLFADRTFRIDMLDRSKLSALCLIRRHGLVTSVRAVVGVQCHSHLSMEKNGYHFPYQWQRKNMSKGSIKFSLFLATTVFPSEMIMGTENIFHNGDIALQYKNTLDQEVATKLHVVEFSKVPNGGLDGMKYSLLQDVLMLTVISWNVIVGLIYRTLLFKYTWENGIFNRPINLLTGSVKH